LEMEPIRRSAAHLSVLRPGPLVAGPISQLALGAAGGRARLVLRTRSQPGRQHPRGHGDPYVGGHHVARFLRIAYNFLAMAKLGFLGLGLMGYPMARNLLRAGHQVAVWSNTKEKARKLAADEKGQFCETPKQVAENADCVF